MDADQPVVIYSSPDVAQLEVIRAALEGQGIECFIENEHQAAMTGVLASRLLVRAADVDQAREFIAAHQHRSDSKKH